MSSLPGYTLEAYLMWAYNLTVEDQPDANFSLALATAIGNIQPRRHLTTAEFAVIVARFEQWREQVEQRLEDFDEENQSWRGYAGCTFDDVGGEEDDKWVFDYLRGLQGEKQ